MSASAATGGIEARQDAGHIGLAAVRRAAGIALLLAFALAVAFSFAATPRRTGDAHQYIAMALQLSSLRPPWLSSGEEAHYKRWLEAQPPESGFPDGARAVRQPTLVRENRVEFSHFWLYPLLASPAVAVTAAVGMHPLVGFTATNAALLGGALWIAARVFGPLAAMLILCSPIVWFVARAQVEVFTVALLCVAMAAAASGHWGWASLAVATASTQNAPIAAALPVLWCAGIADWAIARRLQRLPRRPDRAEVLRAVALAGAGVFIALLHPAYYLWRLGVVTPQELNNGIAGEVPSWGRYLAPLIDPDIGFVVWMPITTLLATIGVWTIVRTPAATEAKCRLLLTAACALAMGLWFLFVFAQTTNVNSGGTVHISRYALWLLPLALPALTAVTQSLDARATGFMVLAATVLFGVYLGYFRPDQPERYVQHSPQATALMNHLPEFYRPIPEIFVERTLHIDGGPRASAASPGCRLLLIVVAHQEQPCGLTDLEHARVIERFASGDQAVWVRRTGGEVGAVTTAIPGP